MDKVIKEMEFTTMDAIDKEYARKVLEHAMKCLEDGTLEGIVVLLMAPPDEDEKRKYAKEIGDKKIIGSAYCTSLEDHAGSMISMASEICNTVLMPLQIRHAMSNGAVAVLLPAPQSDESPADSSGTDPERPRSH